MLEIEGRTLPNSLGEMLRGSAAADPAKPAVVFNGETTSYGALDVMVDTLAAHLRKKGIGKGDKVALYMVNSPFFIAAYFAIARAGAVIVPINLLLNAEEITYILENSEAKGIIFYEAFAEMVKNVFPQAPGATVRVAVGSAGEVEADSFADIMASPVQDFTPAEIDREDLAAILYTSGTTGKAKGAMLSHRNLLANATAASIALKTGPDDRFLTVLPMFHSFAGTAGLVMPLICRATIIPVVRFMPDDVGRTIAQQQATVFLGVPSMYTIFTNLPEERRPDLSSLKLAVSGGASMPVEVMKRFKERYGIPILEGDGPTECGPVTTVNPVGGVRKPGTIGPPIPSVEMRIVDDEGNDLPVNEIGEIVVRGPSVISGYWKNPDATEESFFGDWFRTGDLGNVDEDGYFSIVDRKKDLIIVNGMNVYPRQVEEVIYRMPQVAEVAVVPEPERLHGEVPRAVIALKEGQELTQQEVMSFCRTHLGRFQVPRIVEFMDALPKNATGKILKRELTRKGEVERGIDNSP